jgi:hypothetical protein
LAAYRHMHGFALQVHSHMLTLSIYVNVLNVNMCK